MWLWTCQRHCEWFKLHCQRQCKFNILNPSLYVDDMKSSSSGSWMWRHVWHMLFQVLPRRVIWTNAFFFNADHSHCIGRPGLPWSSTWSAVNISAFSTCLFDPIHRLTYAIFINPFYLLPLTSPTNSSHHFHNCDCLLVLPKSGKVEPCSSFISPHDLSNQGELVEINIYIFSYRLDYLSNGCHLKASFKGYTQLRVMSGLMEYYCGKYSLLVCFSLPDIDKFYNMISYFIS